MSPYIKHIVSSDHGQFVSELPFQQLSPDWLPFLIIGFFSFISATIAFMLKETKVSHKYVLTQQ